MGGSNNVLRVDGNFLGKGNPFFGENIFLLKKKSYHFWMSIITSHYHFFFAGHYTPNDVY